MKVRLPDGTLYDFAGERYDDEASGDPYGVQRFETIRQGYEPHTLADFERMEMPSEAEMAEQAVKDYWYEREHAKAMQTARTTRIQTRAHRLILERIQREKGMTEAEATNYYWNEERLDGATKAAAEYQREHALPGTAVEWSV